jgi:hypothetical protein
MCKNIQFPQLVCLPPVHHVLMGNVKRR